MAGALPDYPDSDFSEDDLSPLDISFNNAASHVRKITNKLDNNQLLQLYALYKQGTEGKCNIPKPGWLDGKGRKKWDAWSSLGDLSCEDAKLKYIALVQSCDPGCSGLVTNEESGAKESWITVSSLRRTPEPELVQNELTLLDAARENLAALVTQILSKNPELKYEKDEDGLTALHWAADRDAIDALQAAIKGGCVLDAVDDCGQTALHYAASCGHVASTKILIEAGASLLKDNEESTPEDLAADNEIRQILQGAKPKH